jgi:hypothetical protein
MYSPSSTAAFVKAVRAFSVQTPDWADAIRYFTKPDERFDITLIADRVYGDRGQYLAIFAAAGMDTLEQQLPEQRLVLPTTGQLMLIKRQTGYLTDAEQRAIESLN